MDLSKFVDIKNYKDLYQINQLGDVVRVDRKNVKKLRHNKPVAGYPAVQLYKNNKRKNYLIHRLIAEAFIPNPEHKLQVNHINGIKHDNRIENLEWCTPSENMKHAFRTGLNKQGHKSTNNGENSSRAKISNQIAIEIYKAEGKQRDIASKFNISQTQVFRIKNKQRWGHLHGIK